MSKNGNGEGSIYEHKKSGKKVGYRGAYTVHTPEGSKRRYVTGKDRNAVRERLTKLMADRDGGLGFDASNLAVGEHMARWLRGSARSTVRASTFERCEQLTRLHIVPALGCLKLKALTPAHVRGFYMDRLDSGLAPATIHRIHTCLNKALTQAVADGLIPRNAADSVKLPRIDREEISPLTATEANRLIEAAAESGDRLEALYMLAIHTGLRQGELLALRWEDLDLEASTLRVRRTLTRTKGTYSTGEPKTKKSRRTVRLTTGAVAALRGHLKRQLEEIDCLGSLYRTGGLVFANETGGIMNPSNLRNRSFAKLLRRAGLPPHTRFHDLRHTCATLLLLRNVNPKVVSEMLGHATIAITLDTYSHVLPDMQEKAAKALEEALS